MGIYTYAGKERQIARERYVEIYLERRDMDKLVVLDFGSQYSHLICRRIREANVYCELLPYNTPAKVIKEIDPKGIIFSGGPASVYAENAPKPDKEIFNMGKPLLGICYGHQVLVDTFGGKVKRSNSREYGRSVLIIEGKEEDTPDLFKGLGPGIMNCWMSHADAAEELPEGFKVLARTESSFSAAIGNINKKYYGIQFHPEVVHTEKGTQILKNFAQTISGAKPEWNIESFIESTINDIRKQVGKEKVLAAVSGGIDSTTVAALMHKAIGEQLSCVFINHGLLRQDEEKDVVKLFKDHLGINVIYVNAEKQFLGKLKGISDPEEKRKVIGEEFANVFAAVVKKKKNNDEGKDTDSFQWLAQGTLYPDVIESGVSKGPAAVIKTHHNVGGLPKWLNLKVIEPLRYLYKDEVRKAAKLLGVPNELLRRHPFPGPGLAVRIIGEVTPEKIRICKHASKIVEDELKSTAAFAPPTFASIAPATADTDNNVGWYDKVWQAYAAVGNDRAVGVLGDERVYGHIVIIRIVESSDAMTADWSRLPYELIEKISNRITNEVEGVTWVTYAVSSKPPATIEPQ
jgi:GMP synthase (glutamine-hydrolysing)